MDSVADAASTRATLGSACVNCRKVILNGSTGSAAVTALSAPNRRCAAVFAPNVLLQYAMGPVADPTGKYCGLRFAGELLDFGYYAIPYNRRVPPNIVEAIDVLILAILDSGNYTATSLKTDFPVQRPGCAQLAAEVAAATAAAAKEPPPLGLEDIAGAQRVLFWCLRASVGGPLWEDQRTHFAPTGVEGVCRACIRTSQCGSVPTSPQVSSSCCSWAASSLRSPTPLAVTGGVPRRRNMSTEWAAREREIWCVNRPSFCICVDDTVCSDDSPVGSVFPVG